MSSIVQPLSLDHPGGIGSIHFHWTDDRYDHVIQLDHHRIACRRQDANPAWPESPPIQQLSIETIDGLPTALGIGCAGTSHWSVSIETTDDGFRFDWACRVKEVPERLGTSYCHDPAFVFEPDENAGVSTLGGVTRAIPRQPISNAGTYRWRYQVHLEQVHLEIGKVDSPSLHS